MTSAKNNLPIIALVVSGVLLAYWSVMTGLVNAWSTDDNYSHGFFIVPLATYVAWERRAQFARAPARRRVVSQARASKKGQQLGWRLRRQIWAETCRTNGWDAGQADARLAARRSYAQAVAAWPLTLQPFKEALRVCIYA